MFAANMFSLVYHLSWSQMQQVHVSPCIHVSSTDSAPRLFHPVSSRVFSRQIQALTLSQRWFTTPLLLRKAIAQRQHEFESKDASRANKFRRHLQHYVPRPDTFLRAAINPCSSQMSPRAPRRSIYCDTTSDHSFDVLQVSPTLAVLSPTFV